jgi:replication factor C small subunit
MWIEQYRPQSLDDVVGQDHIVERLKFLVSELHRTGNDAGFPHLMFAGVAGVGKTSTAIALMKSAFGDDWDSNFIELNASDERSISTVRTTVKEFARRGTMGVYETTDGSVHAIPFNVVFLDECDNLTPDAQSALRRIMEKYSKQTRFILSCNYPHKVISPIKDRCAFSDTRFQPIPKKDIYGALQAVVAQEGVEIASDALKAVATASKGSMRKALNILFTVSRIPSKVELDDVREIVHEMSESQLREMLGLAIQANGVENDNKKYASIHRRLDSMLERLSAKGLSGVEILDAFHNTVQADDKVPVSLRRAIYQHIGEAIYWASVAQDDLLIVKTFLRRVSA